MLPVVLGPRVVGLVVGETRGGRFHIGSRPGVDLDDRFPLRGIGNRFFIPGSLWRGRRFWRCIELTGSSRLSDQLLIPTRIVSNRFFCWRLLLGRGTADPYFLRVHPGGDDGFGDVGPLPLPRPRSTIPFYLVPVEIFSVLERRRPRLPRVALTVKLRQRFRFWFDSIRRFVTGVADTVAVPVGKVRGGNVRAVVRLVGNSVTVRVLIDRAGVAIPVAVCIGLIRVLDIGAVVERVWDVVAVRIELEEGRFVGRSGIVACCEWLLESRRGDFVRVNVALTGINRRSGLCRDVVLPVVSIFRSRLDDRTDGVLAGDDQGEHA